MFNHGNKFRTIIYKFTQAKMIYWYDIFLNIIYCSVMIFNLGSAFGKGQLSVSQRRGINLIHLFWFCTITSSFWQKFKQWLINDKKISSNTGYGPYLFNHNWFKTKCFQNQKKSISVYFLIARYFIWFCREWDRAPSLKYFSSFVISFDASR